jgi:hypothetical protein
MANVVKNDSRRSCSGHISIRVEIELRAGNISTNSPCPCQVMPTRTEFPRYLHSISSILIYDFTHEECPDLWIEATSADRQSAVKVPALNHLMIKRPFFSGSLTASVIALIYALPSVFVCSLNDNQFRLPEFHLNSSEILEVLCFAQPVRKLETGRKVPLSANLRLPIQVCDPRYA